MRTETKQRVTWAQECRNIFFRRWKEKMVALVLAFFFWNMVKQRVHPAGQTQRDFIRQHGLLEQSGLAP